MKEILFRGLRTDMPKWVEGFYVHLHKSTYCFIGEGGPDNEIHRIAFEEMTDCGLPNHHLWADVDPKTVGQYIGIEDINHKKIFEGDLVTIPGSKRQGLPAIVRWNKDMCAFTLHRNGYNEILFDSEGETKYEVTGNIYGV